MRTKEKQYRHSTVNIEDIKFPTVTVDNILHYKDICEKYNTSTNIEEKTKLSYMLPPELFCTCRICGKRIINSNFIVDVNIKHSYITIGVPSVKYRIIDGVKHELSCCEDCLKEHFKDCLPKAPKYYFMKANKYGAYCFNYTEDEYKKICSQTVGVTEKSMIRKWGEVEGKKRWEEYCKKQAETNTFEYKQEKYGWTKEQFDEFNKSRAVTLELCIERHGEEGRKLWDDYCKRQSYTNSLEYMIKEYGEEEGTKKYKEFNFARANTSSITYSKMSQKLFNELYNLIEAKDNIFYYTLNNEYSVITNTKVYNLDFYDKTKNLVIEFLGDYWHANPLLYKEDDKFIRSNKPVTAKQIWKADKSRKNNICKQLNNPIYIEIWESDWNKDPEKVINDILKYYK
jgi:hypothetical protein